MVTFIVRPGGPFSSQAEAFAKRLKKELSDVICEKHPKASQQVTMGVDHLEDELTLFCEVSPSCCKQFTQLLQMAVTKEWLAYKEEIREA